MPTCPIVLGYKEHIFSSINLKITVVAVYASVDNQYLLVDKIQMYISKSITSIWIFEFRSSQCRKVKRIKGVTQKPK